MIAIDINDKTTYSLPENWAEVIAAGKYLDVVEVLFTESDKTKARQQVIECLTGMTAEKLKIDQMPILATMDIIDLVWPVLDFIFKPDLLTSNPLPIIRHKGNTYYGPAEYLSKQTGSEMEECGWAYAEFMKTNDDKFLNHLVAAMYYPKHTTNGTIKGYNKEHVEKRAIHFAELNPTLKRGVLLFYEMCEQWWRQNYDFLYEDGDDDGSEIDSLGTSRIIRMLAGTKRGTVTDVRLLTRDEIYFELAELERERRQLEKRSNK